MAVIFDTNALSAFADGDEKLLRALENEHELALPPIVLGEYSSASISRDCVLPTKPGSKRTFRSSFSFRWFEKPLSATLRSGMS